MINWLVNRVVTRVTPSIRQAVREELDARDDTLRAEHRKLLREAEDTLDKLARRASREGMRKVREAREHLDDAPGPVALAAEPATSNGHPSVAVTDKSALRRQFGHLLLRRPS